MHSLPAVATEREAVELGLERYGELWLSPLVGGRETLRVAPILDRESGLEHPTPHP